MRFKEWMETFGTIHTVYQRGDDPTPFTQRGIVSKYQATDKKKPIDPLNALSPIRGASVSSSDLPRLRGISAAAL